MKIKCITVGPLSTNCYILHDDKTGIIIDPGADGDIIYSYIVDVNIEISMIILTHTHFDHMGAVDFLKTKTAAKIAVGEFDIHGYSCQPVMFSHISLPTNPPDILLKDGDEITIGNEKLHVIHTPGHTLGGITLIGESFVFCGDTLFCESIGRTDLPGGDFQTEIMSVRKILENDNDTILYCGHGPASTVGHEKKYNFYLR